MKNAIRILLILLLAMGVCFGGLSCGSKEKPKKKPSATKKKKRTKEPPKPVKEDLPAAPAKPPLPQDLTQWGDKDFLRAREEGDDRLDEACARLGAPFENEPSAASAVEILRNILTPLPIPEMPDIPAPVFTEDTTPQEKNLMEREYRNRIKAEEDKIKHIPKLNSRTIGAIIEILGQNGDDAAWKLMVDIVQRRQSIDDDSDIEKNVVQTILAHPRSNNLDLIFQMITQPGVFLKPAVPLKDGKRRITSTQVRTMAIDWMKKNSDPEFRERVTDYILAHPEDVELRTLSIPYLISPLVGNIRCMQKIYMAPNLLNPNDREKVERYFLNCSASAFASITNQAALVGKPTQIDVINALSSRPYGETPIENPAPAQSADNADSENAGEAEADSEEPVVSQQAPQKKGTSWRIEPYADTQITDSFKMMAFEPEYAIMILNVVWQNDFITRQMQTWEKTSEFKNRDQDAVARFLMELPLTGYRQYWDDFFTAAYQDGPLRIDKMPLMGYMPTDFGLILELKKVKRNVLPPTQQKKPPVSSRNSNAYKVKQRQIELQGQWMEFVRLAVKMQMERCNVAAAVQKALEVDVEKLKARTPFNIPEDAHVLCEYHMILPNEKTKDIQGIQIDPVEIHYVQIQWDAPALTIPSKIKYKDAATKQRFNAPRSSDMGSLWFEYTNADCSESFDIRIPVSGQSKEELKEPAKGPIQLMSIRVRSNN